jgi:multiple sugar transport system ATP-binding protein
MAPIVFDGVRKIYRDGTEAVSSFDLEVADGQLVVLVGPSGCGKTTVLRMVAGLEEISEGTIAIDGRVVNDVSPRDRDIAMVFQNYALYPQLTIYDNLGFGLKLRKTDKREIDRRVREAAHSLGLEELLDKKPANLSGGQRQRVAMGRAIVREPQAFLMDEPLSNLDAQLRALMRAEIARLQQQLGVTTLYVTHDQTEAMTMGDRVAVMSRGVLQAYDTPVRLYERPPNLFVAGFIGSPSMNLAEASLERADGGLAVVLGEHRLPLTEATVRARSGLGARVGESVVVGIRPESIEDAAFSGDTEGTSLRVVIDLREDMGSETLAHFTVAARGVGLIRQVEGLADGHRTTFVARLDPRTRARAGEPTELRLAPGALHFFVPETGAAIA